MLIGIKFISYYLRGNKNLIIKYNANYYSSTS
jgi:hypothetical protein